MGRAQKPEDEGKRAGTHASAAKPPSSPREKAAQRQGQEPEPSTGQATQRRVVPIALVHARLREDDVRFTELLEQQGGFPFSDVVRRIYHKGVLLEAASSAPDEEGRYGLYSGVRLAELVLPMVDALIAFVMRQGHTPHTIEVFQALFDRAGGAWQPSPSASVVPTKPSPIPPGEGDLLTEVAPAANAVLRLFLSAPQEDAGEFEDENEGEL